MKKIILKTSFFIIPFLFLHFINIFFYLNNEGDLNRIGYFYNNPSPMSKVSMQFSLSKQYTLTSELNLNTKTNFDVLTIGDSFSEQDSLGYKNFLAKEDISVLHIDRFLSENPIQKLIELINSDFFDFVSIKYVVLQSVEREFVQRFQKIDFSKSLTLSSMKSQINNYEEKVPKQNLAFFSKATLKIPLTNIQYLFNNKPNYSQTYKVDISRDNLFTGNPKHLLFFKDDIDYMAFKNDSLKIIECTNNLNKINSLLTKKNIQLIVLISPDKYDLYYPHIKYKNIFKEPKFFKFYNSLSKDYIHINALEILTREIEKNKDVYYYSSTHWSPIGASVIAKEIKKSINYNKLQISNSISK
ncbi:acetyltransferase AlgX (SGNH hydrolase-like protein) [Mariniflexile fucanivorans]|uniref:Acetyltransferase AlgX (SGNH hydrolase-like protein) n=1 Tax=Mariniflexile fucanivorans TaxID=264023 RepID=A0A4R1REM2_9FLAO|nr:hypothetical protein [Mariniflexile fucanivorans]TCL64363.1 acetyltransferase AlgX (SGNH hydrolase-like protein) [Mariniflexile fucanivorans]